MLMLLTTVPDYDKELRRMTEHEDLNLSSGLSKILNHIFNVELSPEAIHFLQIIIWVFVGALVLWIIYKEFILPELNSSSQTFDYDVPAGGLQGTAEDADIRGHNFDEELRQALENEDFALAVRLRYLMTLKMLNEAALLEWKVWKTPLMYVAELKNGAENLLHITNTFLYIKYGHYPATEKVYNEVNAEYQELTLLTKGGSE